MKTTIKYLLAAATLLSLSACGKFPGVEINYRAGIAPTSPEYVTESLQAIMSHGFDGAVLSWNIMEAPVPHIECLRP